MKKPIATLALCNVATVGWAGATPEDFARNPQNRNVFHSPTGDHLAAMRKPLLARGIDPKCLEMKNDGQGLVKTQNRTDFFHALLNVLDRHIGTGERFAVAGR